LHDISRWLSFKFEFAIIDGNEIKMQREWDNIHKMFQENLSQSFKIMKTGEKHGTCMWLCPTYVVVMHVCDCISRV